MMRSWKLVAVILLMVPLVPLDVAGCQESTDRAAEIQSLMRAHEENGFFSGAVLAAEVPVIRFGGSINGFLSSTHSFTQDDRFVVALANAKSPGSEELPSTFAVARNIAAILYGFEYQMPEGGS
jgi:hypothetical protein